MGKILILYDSKSGNTKRMAQLVCEGAQRNFSHEIKMKSVDDADKNDILWCDGIAVGSPTHMGILSWKMKKFWDDMGKELWGKIDGKFGCAFSSSGGIGGGTEISCLSILTVLINYGFLVFGATDYVDNEFTLHYGAITAGYPKGKGPEEACRRIGEKLSKWVSVYIDKKGKQIINQIKEEI